MNTQKTFLKNSSSIEEQIQILQKRKLIFDDIDHAKHCLKTVGYYRLSGYFKPFQQTADDKTHSFKSNVTFQQIWKTYAFDRELRLLMSDALERLEVALRTSLSNTMASRYGSIWYLNNDCFNKHWVTPNKRTHEAPADYFKSEVNKICREQKEEFIKHYFFKYSKPSYPPSWMLIECLSFGKCTSLFRFLKKVSDKSAISEVFGYHPKVVESCLEPLRYTRNLCAHHTRVWNRWFVVTPKHISAFGNVNTKPSSLHEQLSMIDKLNQKISPNSEWKKRTYDLFNRYKEWIPFSLAGFGETWSNDSFWES